MSKTTPTQTMYPDTFDAAQMDVPETPNVTFSFVVKAPKAYVMDAWHLPKEHGGSIEPLTEGNPAGDGAWPGITNNMERKIYITGIGVTQIVGNVQTPDDGDWHFEWKAGAPYYKMPFPFSAMMKAVHGTATLVDGPGPHETTVKIVNRHRPGIALWLTRFGIRAAMPLLSNAAPSRFKKKTFLGPQNKL